MTRLFLYLGIIAALGAPTSTSSRGQRVDPESSAIRLHDGRNALDLLGTGEAGVVDVADRENFNGHGHHVAIFQVHARVYPGDAKSPVRWQVIPFVEAAPDSGSATDLFGTSEGADCTLRDLRVMRDAPHQPVTVVIAQRELGRSYADSARISFRYYNLRVNSEGIAGYPSYYFLRTKVLQSRSSYCDVDDAFDRELGLGRQGLLKWNGAR